MLHTAYVQFLYFNLVVHFYFLSLSHLSYAFFFYHFYHNESFIFLVLSVWFLIILSLMGVDFPL